MGTGGKSGSRPQGSNLASMVRRAAAAGGERSALWCDGQELTWGELDARVDALAAGVIDLGLRRGDRVALLLGNSIEFVVSYFGALRAGLVVVPMNPAYTGAEVAVLLADSGARLVICDALNAPVAREAAGAIAGCEVVATDAQQWKGLLAAGSLAAGGSADGIADFDAGIDADVEADIKADDVGDADDLAVLLFTAGTSGRPKGAMLTHRSLLANIEALRELTDPAPVLASDVVLAVLPMFHVYGLNTVLGLAVSAGARCVIVDRFDPVESLRLIREHRVTTVAGAPAMYRAWLAIPGLRDALGGVRLFSSGGSSLPVPVFEAFAEQAGAAIFEGYGMTETSPVVCTTLAGGVPKPGSVGRPIPGVEVRLVDAEGRPSVEGDPGEVCVRGPSVFAGYWPGGIGGPDDAGWFRSGDVAFVDGDGDLHLVDRRRELVIVNGFNVYPREIEVAIDALEGVEEVAVVGIPDDRTGDSLMALVVARPGSGLTADAVAVHCAGRLARFKIPSVIRLVDALPHSATGKVAKGRLREVYQGEVDHRGT
ncbi:MAG: AMP-binding protein [Actinomycetales bacterium]|nr:AMP-binding protein [Actinomycetales bacterium]